MGLDGKAKWEVGSGKWEKRIIGPFLVQSTLSGYFVPNFGFWALKENVAGIWLFKACLGKRYVAVACNSASIRVLVCLETPSAFLEAVPSAWTVTRGCL